MQVKLTGARVPALDGLRGLAVLLVVIGHAWIPWVRMGGQVGVAMFFTLSGFLITTLLLEEHARTGRIDVRAFYLRRGRRLLPALAVSTVAVGVSAIWLGPWFFQWRDAAAVVGYAGNWVMQSGHSLGGLAGTWSLAIEEQFYLVWPVVLILCLRRSVRTVAIVAGVGIVAVMVWRQVLIAGGAGYERVYFGSDTRADSLLIGCLLAVAMYRAAERKPLPLLAAGVTVVLLVLCDLREEVSVYVAPVMVPALTAALIYALVRGKSSGFFAWAPMRLVGQRSYGLYLWHCPVSAWLTLAHPEWGWETRLALILFVAVPLTLLSWRYVEQPFMRQKRMNSTGIRSQAIPQVPATVR